ncbi:MAG: hypothetical protein A2Z15_08275 [Chloroflexi bacterium RBG_16_50_11]|nr:MAG: hypothetical protein A2Z15_08275 [Chloroflexi bacterium RBG_16_50_11]
MKKILLISLALIVIIGVLVTGCSKDEGGGGTTDEGEPVFGGTLRVITASGPQVLGGFEGGPADLGAVLWGLNGYVDATAARGQGNGLEPVLAKEVVEDIEGKRLVFYLKEGILFHDGSELTADVAMWNYQQTMDNGRFWNIAMFDGMEKIDKYTFAIKFKEYSNQFIQNWAWAHPRSQKAYMDATGGDAEKGKVWNRDHIVGAGPFKLVEYKRDSHMTWTKYENYWNKPLPYLDGVNIRYIPDPVAARAIMEKGEADYWLGAPARDQKEMYDAGFKKISGWVGLIMSIWPNTSDPDSIWNNKDLRYALDYALDKPAIALAIGAGLYVPLTQLAPSTEWGYDPNYPVRGYDAAKAKELIEKAGYTTIKTKLLIGNTPAEQDAGTAIKGYLDAVGIETELDVADPGRFFGTVWGKAQPGLSFMWSGMDITNLLTYMRWFSTNPFTNLVYLGHTDYQAALDKEAVTYSDPAKQKEVTERAYKYLNDGAYLIPVYQIPSASVAAKYVHSQQFQQGFVRWQQELIWMDPH